MALRLPATVVGTEHGFTIVEVIDNQSRNVLANRTSIGLRAKFQLAHLTLRELRCDLQSLGEHLHQLPTSLTMTLATYPDSERSSALARASSFERLRSPMVKPIS